MISKEQGFENKRIPKRFKTLHVKGAMSGFASETILDDGDAQKPDYLYLGQWSPLHSFVWDVEVSGKPFSDSGYLLKWKERTLNSGDSLMFSYYYGLPFNGRIRAIPHNNNIETKTLTLYYKAVGSSNLSKKSKNSLDSLLSNGTEFYGGIIEGYGDATGSDAENLRISEKRIKNIVKYLSSKGIDKNTLIPKPYGESQALQNEDSQTKGNIKDRKAKITLYQE